MIYRGLNRFEPLLEKTNSNQVLHKLASTVTEAGYKLEILDLSRRGIVLSFLQKQRR